MPRFTAVAADSPSLWYVWDNTTSRPLVLVNTYGDLTRDGASDLARALAEGLTARKFEPEYKR